jgi:hypothetical protein
MMTREFHDPEELGEWNQVSTLPSGAEEFIIYRDESSGTYSRILRIKPGFAGTSTPLKHDFDEIVYIIEGGVVDCLTGKGYPTKTFAVFPAGMEHGPLAAPVGALLLEFRHYRAQR